MSGLEGFWTYLVPGTNRGGLLCVKNGVVVGGDNIAFFNGLVTEEEDYISVTVLTTRFNENAPRDRLWGESPSRYAMHFVGVRAGDEAFGYFERPGFPQGRFNIVLTYRGPAP